MTIYHLILILLFSMSLPSLILRLFLIIMPMALSIRHYGKERRLHGAFVATLAFFILFVVLFVIPFQSCKAHLGSHQKIGVAYELKQYFKRYGVYPESLDELCANTKDGETINSYDLKLFCKDKLDQWGNQPFYQKRNAGFILVSYGSDGRPSGIDYWEIREKDTMLSICGYTSADIVISDKGHHLTCGK